MKIALLGDIALFGVFNINNNKELLSKLNDVASYLSQFDYVIGNLETPFSEKKKPYGAKSAYISSDKECIKILNHLHISAVNLSNNHIFDYGEEGYNLTVDLLNKNGIKYFGTDGKSFYIKDKNNKLAFSGFCCYTSNPLKNVEYGSHGVNEFDFTKVSEILNENSSKGYFNIFSVHSGFEHVNYPSLENIIISRKLAEISPYIYYGHHPHVIQGLEKYKGSLIAHSLGNFSFDDVYSSASDKPLVTLSENNRTGLILEITIEDNKIISYKPTSIYIEKNGSISINKTDNTTYYPFTHLLENEELYRTMRNKLVNNYISGRKSMRNIKWFLKRLKIRYILMILNSRRNKKLYNRKVKQFIYK